MRTCKPTQRPVCEPLGLLLASRNEGSLSRICYGAPVLKRARQILAERLDVVSLSGVVEGILAGKTRGQIVLP